MRKLLLVVPMIVLLAAGCQSGSGSSYQSSDDSQAAPTATPTPKPTASSAALMSGSGSWQATLMQSDNSAKGAYMIQTGGHTIYLRTSRDFSSLVGKAVSVKYNGTMDKFGLVDIMGQ